MKYLLALLLLLNLSPLLAQNCTGFYYMQPNKTITMSYSDRNGKASGSCVYKITEVQQNGNTMTSVVHAQMTDEKGKQLSASESHMKCNGGTYQVDMKILLPKQQAEQFRNTDVNSGFYLEYPALMKTGDALKDGSFNADTKNDNGMSMELEMNIIDRVVQAEEEITTTAGTWKCFKITQKYKVRVQVSGIGIPFQIESTEWFAPGFGVVKSSSRWGGSMITSIE